jgi:hypothetical protein
MSISRREPTRRSWLGVAPAILAAYACLLAAGPLDHHDIACHLKSTTHCTTCLSASVPGTEVRPGAAICPLTFTDLLLFDRVAWLGLDIASKPGDRSPPAA